MCSLDQFAPSVGYAYRAGSAMHWNLDLETQSKTQKLFGTEAAIVILILNEETNLGYKSAESELHDQQLFSKSGTLDGTAPVHPQTARHVESPETWATQNYSETLVDVRSTSVPLYPRGCSIQFLCSPMLWGLSQYRLWGDRIAGHCRLMVRTDVQERRLWEPGFAGTKGSGNGSANPEDPQMRFREEF